MVDAWMLFKETFNEATWMLFRVDYFSFFCPCFLFILCDLGILVSELFATLDCYRIIIMLILVTGAPIELVVHYSIYSLYLICLFLYLLCFSPRNIIFTCFMSCKDSATYSIIS